MNSCQQEWDAYQRLERRFLLVFMGYIPVWILAIVLAVKICGSTPVVPIINTSIPQCGQ
jgi:hypothetical protein